MSKVTEWRKKYREALPKTKTKLLSLVPLLVLPLLGVVGVWEALGFPPWADGRIGSLVTMSLYTTLLIYAYVVDMHAKVVDVESETTSIDATVGMISSFGRIYPYDDDHYLEGDSIDVDIDETPDRSILIEYSSNEGQTVRDKLLKQEGDVYLFLKLPRDAIDAGGWEDAERGDQEDRIVSEFKQILTDDPDYLDDLNVVFYRAPASVRARLVGDEQIFIGWYHFEGGNSEPTIWGHCDPVLHVERNHESFQPLRNFIEGMVAPRLWETAVFPEDLVDEDADIETPQWVTEKFGEKAEEQFQAVSPDQTGFEEEFDVEIDSSKGPTGYQEVVGRTE